MSKSTSVNIGVHISVNTSVNISVNLSEREVRQRLSALRCVSVHIRIVISMGVKVSERKVGLTKVIERSGL